jgi:hypothetical protein
MPMDLPFCNRSIDVEFLDRASCSAPVKKADKHSIQSKSTLKGLCLMDIECEMLGVKCSHGISGEEGLASAF